MWSHGSFYWNELMTRNVEAAKAFYGNALGWTFDAMPMPEGTYWVAKMGDKLVGGLFALGPEHAGVPESWLAYIAVDDVDARAQRAKSAGGKIMREPFDVPGVGRIAILADAEGAGVGFITPANQ